MATVENSKSVWDTIWDREGLESWRRYPGVFGRIEFCLKHIPNIGTRTALDVGCGVGILLDKVHKATGVRGVGVDLSDVAIKTLRKQGYSGVVMDLEAPDFELPVKVPNGASIDIVLCTEVVEHLTHPQFQRLLVQCACYEYCFISTPNNCLGPDEEPQHVRKLTAKKFLDILKSYRPDFRVECHDHYLLGIAGYPKRDKGFKLSFTMPVKNEEADIERVLRSFRGVADEIVIGIDDKSDDRTEEIVSWYADKVFKFTWNNDFSAARNACMDHCTGDWIFMSEGHESLNSGIEALLRLGPEEIPSHVDVIEVRREAETSSWYFPWLCRNKPEIRYHNAVHNQLGGYDDDKVARANQISTWHERAVNRSIARKQQRKGMNKQELLRCIRESKGHDLKSMFYLAQEYRDIKSSFGFRQAVYWFERFIKLSAPDPMRYQARISLSKMYFDTARNMWDKDQTKYSKNIKHYLLEAKKTLAGATIDDPTRIEHWMMLGEICESVGQLEFAMRFFEYAALGVGRIPSSYLFIDKASYTYLPAQKLVNIYASLELWNDALAWARKIEGLMPDSAPPEAIEEVRRHVASLEKRVQQEQENMIHVASASR